MRLTAIFTSSFVACSFVAAITAFGACTPYDPTLPAEPFSCGSGTPSCPDGYTCTTDMTSGRKLCEEMPGTGPDAGIAACANDQAIEPNDTPQTATIVPQPFPQDPFTFGGLSICPATDKDNYSVVVSTNGQQTLEVTMTYAAGGAVLSMSVLNSSDTPISTCPGPDCTVTGAKTDFKLTTAPEGTYIIQVLGPGSTSGAGSGENNYQLTFSIE